MQNFAQAPSESGKTRDKIAGRVGFGSGFTYQKAATVVKTADKLAEEGKKEEAQALLNVLNTQSVDAAAAADRQPYGGLLAILCSSLNLCRWAYCSPAWALVPLPIVLFFR